MEALFKKYFWVVQGLGLAVIAGLAASAVVTQLGTMYVLDSASDTSEDEADEEDPEDAEAAEAAAVAARKKKNARASSGLNSASTLASAKRRTSTDVQKRNVFCPTCVPVVETPTATGAPVDMGRPDGIQPGEVKSSLALQLMATMESTDPELSLATVYDADAAITGAYRRGDAIRSGVLVVGVDTGLVHLRNGAQLEYLAIDDEAPAARPTSTPGKTDEPVKEKKKSKYAIDGADDAINCPDENTCVVDRAFVEQLMANPATLAKQARIVPSQRDGETQGFKFYGIRRGSLPKLLGLKNGDMLTEVNGEEIRSVDKAMALAMKLRRANNLSVTLVRKGKTVTKEIQIQ